MPPWIKDDPAESATTITGIFNANLSHLDYSQAREAGQELAQMLATPVEHQLDAVQSNHTLMDLLDHKAPYAPEHLDMTKDSLAEGLAVNDHATVQAAIGNLASMQEQFNRIDTLLEIRTMMEHHDPDGDLAATNDQQPQGFLNRVHSLFRKFWGTDDLQAASGPPPAERLDHAVNEDSQERLQNHFQHHHITQDATQQILDFAQRFDPQGTHEERITWQVLHGERNLLNEEPHVRDQVAEAIVGQITKFDFPELQGYHDAADYLSQALIRPMTYTLLPEDRYEDQDLYDYTELTRYSLDFLSAHSDKDKQLSFLKESLNQIADRVHTLQGGHPDHQATPAFDRTTPRTPPAGTDYGPTGPDNQAEDHRSALDFAPDQAHSSFQLHHIPTESQARLLNFSTNFDPQNSYADSVAYHVVRGERNLLQEDSHVQDQVAAIIVDQVTKSDFPQQQDYHDDRRRPLHGHHPTNASPHQRGLAGQPPYLRRGRDDQAQPGLSELQLRPGETTLPAPQFPRRHHPVRQHLRGVNQVQHTFAKDKGSEDMAYLNADLHCHRDPATPRNSPPSYRKQPASPASAWTPSESPAKSSRPT